MKVKIIKLDYDTIKDNATSIVKCDCDNDLFKLLNLWGIYKQDKIDIEFNPIEYKCNCDIDKCYTFAFIDNILGFKTKNEVIFNEPATILYRNGKKYVSKCDKEDKFSEELGLALCLLKSFGVSYSDFEKLLKGAKRQGNKNEE